jgi:energy-converting hydrogenase Eha subunit C
MKFARIVYWIAAAYGFVSLVPLYFLLDKVGRDAPPPITHPEFYFGFLGVTFLWQIVFVLIAKEPLRYRSLMPITILEKLIYTAPVILLYLDGRVNGNIMRASLVDPIFGVLFVIAYVRTVTKQRSIANAG